MRGGARRARLRARWQRHSRSQKGFESAQDDLGRAGGGVAGRGVGPVGRRGAGDEAFQGRHREDHVDQVFHACQLFALIAGDKGVGFPSRADSGRSADAVDVDFRISGISKLMI